MKKEHLYKTAITTKELPGIKAGEFVAIVKYHEYNDTFTIRSISGVLQCMVDCAYLDRFVI